MSAEAEADALRQRLIERVESHNGDSFHSGMQAFSIQSAFTHMDLETLRVYDRLLKAKTNTSMLDMVITYRKSRGAVNIADTITAEHIAACREIDVVLDHHARVYDRDVVHAVMDIVYEDLSRLDRVISLITRRGISDPEALRSLVGEMEKAAPPLSEGAL